MIKTLAKDPAYKDSYGTIYNQIQHAPTPITLVLESGFHLHFGDEFYSNALWVSDLVDAPKLQAKLNIPYEYQRSPQDMLLEPLAERTDAAYHPQFVKDATPDRVPKPYFEYGLDITNKYRIARKQEPFNPTKTVDTRYGKSGPPADVFENGGTWKASTLFGGSINVHGVLLKRKTAAPPPLPPMPPLFAQPSSSSSGGSSPAPPPPPPPPPPSPPPKNQVGGTPAGQYVAAKLTSAANNPSGPNAGLPTGWAAVPGVGSPTSPVDAYYSTTSTQAVIVFKNPSNAGNSTSYPANPGQSAYADALPAADAALKAIQDDPATAHDQITTDGGGLGGVMAEAFAFGNLLSGSGQNAGPFPQDWFNGDPNVNQQLGAWHNDGNSFEDVNADGSSGSLYSTSAQGVWC